MSLSKRARMQRRIERATSIIATILLFAVFAYIIVSLAGLW